MDAWEQDSYEMPLLDRLLRPAGKGNAFSHADYRNAVQRDLENLLNTRCRVLDFPRDLSALEASLANYGLPDYTGLAGGLEGARDRLRNELRKTIERFEPRLKALRISFMGQAEPLDRRLRFKIEAELLSEPVVFQSVLDQTTARYEVRRAAR